MNKDLKKSYDFLDLTYSATEEDVCAREKALIKIFNSEAKEKNVSCDNEVETTKKHAKIIIENLKKNGPPQEQDERFDSSWQSAGVLLIVLFITAMICFLSFYIFL